MRVFNIIKQEETTDHEIVDNILLICDRQDTAEYQKLLLEQKALTNFDRNFVEEWSNISQQKFRDFFATMDGELPYKADYSNLKIKDKERVPSLAETKAFVKKYGSPYHITGEEVETEVDTEMVEMNGWSNPRILHEIYGDKEIYKSYEIIHHILIDIHERKIKEPNVSYDNQNKKFDVHRPMGLATVTNIFFLPIIESYIVQTAVYSDENHNKFYQFLFNIVDDDIIKVDIKEYLENASLTLKVK